MDVASNVFILTAPEELTKSSSERLKKRNIMVPSIGPPKPYRDRQLPAAGGAANTTTAKTSMESRPLPSPPSQDKINVSGDLGIKRFSPLPPPPIEANENPSISSSPPILIPPSSESPESRPVSYYSTVAADESSDGLYSSVLNDEELEMIRQQVSGSELPVTVRHSSSEAPEPVNDTPPPTGPRDEVCTPRVEVTNNL